MKSGLLLLVAFAALVGAGTSTAAGHKPTVGKPLASPRQPQTGKRFIVAFHVAHGTSAKFTVTLGGASIRHTDSFRAGVARSAVRVPADTQGELLAFTLTAHGTAGTTTRSATYVVHSAALPTLSIDDVSQPEGNSGTTPFVFHVTLSHPSGQTVTVDYATEDAEATAPSDYAQTDGTLTFKPGKTTETITVPVVGDTVVEPDEVFNVILSEPQNASVEQDTGTGTIVNDDTAAPANPGSYKGATQEGNFVFFTVNGDRTLSAFRANDISENCDDGGTFSGSVSWDTLTIPIAADGSFDAVNSWSGSDTQGNITYTAETWKISGQFTSGTSVTGTISMADQFTYNGGAHSCASTVTFTAALQG